jgi:hypothetical protein
MIPTVTDRGPGIYVVVMALGEQLVVNEIEVTE